MDGRVHHPKIWGAREWTFWKPHELESLTSLIDQAMKNTLANKNATVISADEHEFLTTSHTIHLLVQNLIRNTHEMLQIVTQSKDLNLSQDL